MLLNLTLASKFISLSSKKEEEYSAMYVLL